jgi:hypothetical protein
MTSNDSKNDILVMVLIDLAAICKKLADNPDVSDRARLKAHQFVEESNLLLPSRGKSEAQQHAAGEQLLTRIARFLPTLLEAEARPRMVVNE